MAAGGSMKQRTALSILLAIVLLFSCRPGFAGETFPNAGVWLAHWQEDIRPFWDNAAALGDPPGNYPTFRDMAGKPTAQGERYARMISRQVYTYAIGYALSGDASLLLKAKAGIDWLLAHAKHPGLGYHPILDAEGRPLPGNSKTAQDMAYCMLGFAAYHFVTGDEACEREILEMRELIMAGPFWDKGKGTVRDAMDGELKVEVEFKTPGNDLVAVLDQVNAYMLLFANQTRSPEYRRMFLDDLRRLADRLVAGFWERGIFWSTELNRTDYRADHVDVGHTVKAYWMLYEIDSQWFAASGLHPYLPLLQAHAKRLLTSAFANGLGPWGKYFDGAYDNIRADNPDWWMHCECDQFAARLSLADKSYVPMLERTTAFWLHSGFVDRGRPVRGIRSGIKWDGSLYGDDVEWDAKAHFWKNGYHETEHALVLYLLSCQLQEQPALLYFAVPRERAAAFQPRPYLFQGREVSHSDRGPIPGTGLQKIRIGFTDLH
jgi:mannose/cellobiose epimerase-like protein (N-acyl-D-glucosamine 2-epimerase family)